MVNESGKLESEPLTHVLVLGLAIFCVEWDPHPLLVGKSFLSHHLGYPFSFSFSIFIPIHTPSSHPLNMWYKIDIENTNNEVHYTKNGSGQLFWNIFFFQNWTCNLKLKELLTDKVHQLIKCAMVPY